MKMLAFWNKQTGWARVIVLVIALWSALVAGSLAWYMRHEQQSILSAATIAARANLNKDIGFRNWVASHGGVYVSPTEHTPPNPYLKVPERDVVTTSGKTLTLMNPAYALRQMQSDFSDNYGIKSRITSLKPLNPDNAPDAWETKALQAFERGSKEMLETQQVDGQPHLRMMLPFVVEQGCLKCHAQQGYKLGDIRGGISSDVPLAPFAASEREIKNDLILSHGAIWLLGLSGLAWLGVLFRRIERMEILAHSAAAIEESERRFRAVTESANDAIISADSTGRVVGWNPGAARLFGYTEAEIIGQPLTMLMPERFCDPHRAGLARVLAGGTPHVIGKTVELVGLHKDGSEFTLELSLAQWQAADGRFFTATLRDITERKQMEQALQGSESKYRRLIENSPDIAYTFSVKRGGIYLSSQVISILGYSVENLYANPFLWNESIHPEDRAVVTKAVEELKTGSPFKIEYRIKNANGDWRWFYDRSTGSREENGDFIIEGLAMDVTERKRNEEAINDMANMLRDSRQLLDSIVEHIPVMVFVKRASDLCFELFNHAGEKLLGYSRNDLLGKGNYDFWPKDQGDWFTAADRKVLASDEVTEILEEPIKTASGETRYLHTWKVALRDESGKPAHLLGISIDITEQKLAEAKLAEQVDELRRWHEATSGREGRILVLKHEINELLAQAGQPPRYLSAEESDA